MSSKSRALPLPRHNLPPPLSTKLISSVSRSLWIPNVLIVNVKSFKTMSGLEDETGLFIRDSGPGKPMDVLYIQLAEVTILCPMRYAKK